MTTSLIDMRLVCGFRLDAEVGIWDSVMWGITHHWWATDDGRTAT